MKNPTPRMQMIDGFNAGWIDFPDHGAHARKGFIGIDQAIATLIQRARMNGVPLLPRYKFSATRKE
jgi:hypothetical protein